ncbi:MAG: YdeI/OmpD-associated family protein [Bacteroidota bacterium]
MAKSTPSNNRNPAVDAYLLDGCMRCSLGATPECKVHRWNLVLDALRTLVLSTGLTEERKWGAPCYTHNGKNVLMLGAFKNHVSVGFFKGALIHDSKSILVIPGPNSNSTRAFRATNLSDVKKHQAALLNFIHQAIELEERGEKVQRVVKDQRWPDELHEVFEQDAVYKQSFLSLTPGRQRGYVIHFSEAKQAATRTARINKYRDQILSGEGLHDAYKRKR